MRHSFSSVGISPWTGASFGISVGTAIPETVVLHEVPPAIYEIVPAWRGYKVVLVRDEYVVIEPRTRKIVTVIHKG